MKLRLASINFWGLPWPLSVQKKARIAKLISFIRKNSFDIICMQEIWRTWDLDLLKSRLKEYYFFDYAKRKRNPSGLAIISRFPIIEEYFIPFWNLHYEFALKKGMLIAKVIAGKNIMRIINTHLISTFRPLRSKIWARQLTSVYSALNNIPTLVFGDFNFNYNDFPLPELRLLTSKAWPTRNTSNPYSKRSLNRFSKVNMTCDMILSNFQVKVSKQEVLRSNIFSDHYSVMCDIAVR
jgi:endonuclease/exonuclease/phosphatase family metal-dependent hydrolase